MRVRTQNLYGSILSVFINGCCKSYPSTFWTATDIAVLSDKFAHDIISIQHSDLYSVHEGL